MKFINLFGVGTVDYADEGFDKPVRFSSETLKYLAENLGETKLTREHTDESIGSYNNFRFKDDFLQVEVPDDFEGGLSPVFQADWNLVGDYYEPVQDSLRMTSIGLTNNPRTGIIYNSNKGDDTVDDNKFNDLLTRKDERITEQQEEIAILRKQYEELQDKFNDSSKESKELQAKIKELTNLETELESYKADAEKYRVQEAEARAELITQIAGDDEKAKEIFKNTSIEDLKYMLEQKTVTEPPKGATTNNAQGNVQDGSEPPATQVNEDDKYTYEAFKEWEDSLDEW